MSNIAMQGGATGTGTVTLLAPSTSTNRTLTLPDAAGTVALQGGAGVGKVLQVVNATYTTVTGTSSTSYQDTGLTATITPTSATSKILVAFHQNGLTRDTVASTAMTIQLLRGASQISFVVSSTLYSNASYGVGQTVSTSYLDSPATVSATTYKTQFKVANAFGGTVTCQSDSAMSTMTLMEIAA